MNKSESVGKIIVPVSGGKDSLSCLLLALDAYPKEHVTPVFNDTGWEHEETYKYLNYLEIALDIPIVRTVGGARGKTLEDLILVQGKFPFGLGRFCTMYLKQYAFRDWYKDNMFDGVTQYQVWFGMRTQESNQRANKYGGIACDELFDIGDLFPNRYNKKLRATIQARLPVVTWSTRQIFRYIEKKGLIRNPLYREGTNDRVGCYPCMLAGKKVQAKMFATDFGQKQLQRIRVLEEKIGQKYEMHDTDQGSCELCKI